MSDAVQRLIYVLPVPTQPRFRKRIGGLEAHGLASKVFSFERKYLQEGGVNLQFVSLGNIQGRKYLSRVPALLRAAMTIATELKAGDTIYCFGADLAAMAIMARAISRETNISVVLERGDIGPAMVRGGLRGKVVRWSERLILRRCARIVVTSAGYIDGYFASVQGIERRRFVTIENKLDGAGMIMRSQRNWDGNRPLQIGYFGVLRDPASWRILVECAARSQGRIEVHAYGKAIGIPGFHADVNRSPYVYYHGEYRWPDGLSHIYGSVDMIWGCFPKSPATSPMKLWTLPMTNRFYEACAAGVPVIAQRGSLEGERVLRYGIGTLVNTDDAEQAIDTVLGITPATLAGWRDAYAQLPEDVYLYTDEHERLLMALNSARSEGLP